MKKILLITATLLMFQYMNAGNFCDPDSLSLVTKTGKAIVMISGNNTHYYLDENNDDTADYILNFGPFWYSPTTGNAVRPADGDSISIVGGLNSTNPSTIPVIVVYEIDGEFWRNPYEPFWNEFNNNYSQKGGDSGNAYCPGWFQNNPTLTNLTGTVFIDSTFIYLRYFLDTDYDGNIDYKLNFGPHWYTPALAIDFPNEGDTVTVLGGLIQLNKLPVVIVFELNGEEWRDSTGYSDRQSGKWMSKSMSGNSTVNEFFDDSNRLRIMQGWHHGSMPSNMFCQMIQVHVRNQPEYQNQNGFAGYQCGFFDSTGKNLMNFQRNRFIFNNKTQVQFHFNEAQLKRAGIQIHDRDRIRLKAWDHDGRLWQEVAGAVVDTQNYLLTFSSDTIAAFYMLSALDENSSVKLIEKDEITVYPNPASSFINIKFELSEPDNNEIIIYNMMGEVVLTLEIDAENINQNQILSIDTTRLTPGIYYLRMNNRGFSTNTTFIISR